MAISDSVSALRTIYTTQIAALTDSLTAAKALVALDTWEGAAIAYAGQVAAEAQSYSTVGRAVTKRRLDEARDALTAAQADLEGLLGIGEAGVTYVDFGGRI